MAKIKITRRFAQDYHSLLKDLKKNNLAKANSLFNEVDHTLYKNLSLFPKMYGKVFEDIRHYHLKTLPLTIPYWYAPDMDTVFLLHILHQNEKPK